MSSVRRTSKWPTWVVTTVPLLRIESLTVRYGAAIAVAALTFEVAAGEILAILGPNGAGKTSTLRGTMGLEPGAKGTVVLEGRDVSGSRPHQLVRSRLALVPQGRRVFASLTVEENLLLGGYVQRDRQLASKLLGETYEMFPVLGERRQQRPGYLSGGEQQMLAFGRALMANPLVVLMDEPSMGLAPIVVEQVMGAARAIADNGIGVVMVEQN